MLAARCKLCGSELTSSSRIKSCGCSNRMIVSKDSVTANDLSEVVLLNYKDIVKSNGILTADDLKYQEARRKRRIRKLNFEER